MKLPNMMRTTGERLVTALSATTDELLLRWLIHAVTTPYAIVFALVLPISATAALGQVTVEISPELSAIHKSGVLKLDGGRPESVLLPSVPAKDSYLVLASARRGPVTTFAPPPGKQTTQSADWKSARNLKKLPHLQLDWSAQLEANGRLCGDANILLAGKRSPGCAGAGARPSADE